MACRAIIVPVVSPKLPQKPPFAIRARLVTPLSSGPTRFETDALVEVDSDGILARVRPWSAGAQADAQERRQQLRLALGGCRQEQVAQQLKLVLVRSVLHQVPVLACSKQNACSD